MDIQITQLRGMDAQRAILLIDSARHGKLKATSDIYGFKSKSRALLVEPLNESPFVLIDETAEHTPGTISLPRVTRMEFVPEPRSGTDKLRARIQASLCFDDLPDEPLKPTPNAELIIEPLVKRRLGPCQKHDQASAEALEQEANAGTPSP
jgi:hypothetical protein